MQPFYVYTLARPDGTVFYVGKGSGKRIDQHEPEARNGGDSYKCRVIRKVWKDGGAIIKRKVQEGLTEEQAYQAEMKIIAEYGRNNLTNLTDGGEGGSKRPYEYHKITLELPEEVWEYISQVSPNRTKWIVETLQERIEREKA